MAAVTLLEQTKLITNPAEVLVANVFALEYEIMGLLPFEEMSGYHKPYTVVDTLPTVAPRDFGVDFTADYGKSSTYNVPWKNYGGRLEVDKALRVGNPKGAAQQEMMQIQAIAKQWSTHIFEGVGGTSITGIKTFLSSFYPGQIAYAGSTSGGDLLTMDMMDAAFNLVVKDEKTAIFCSQIVRNRLSYLARTAYSIINFQPDQFGNQVLSYNGVPIYCMIDGYTSKDLLSTTELDHGGGANTTSSLYIVNFGEETVSGFSPQAQTLQVEVLNPGTNAWVTRLEMNAGITVVQPRAAAVISSIKQATA